MEQQALETARLLWIAIGFLIASNFGVFSKMFFDWRARAKEKKEHQLSAKEQTQVQAIDKLVMTIENNTAALKEFERDLQRMFTAIKLVAGKKWPEISKIIQEEHPRNRN